MKSELTHNGHSKEGKQSAGEGTAHTNGHEMIVITKGESNERKRSVTELPDVEVLENGFSIGYSQAELNKADADTTKTGIDNAVYDEKVDERRDKNSNPVVDENLRSSRTASENNDRKKPPLAFCSSIVRHYRISFTLALCGHLFFVIVSGALTIAGYDLFPLDFQGVPLYIKDDDTYLRALAWKYRDEDESVCYVAVVSVTSVVVRPVLVDEGKLEMVDTFKSLLRVNTSAEAIGARTKNGDILQVFFQASNVLTKERLQAMHDLEIEFTSKPAWRQYCKQDVENMRAGCMKPISLIRFFDGSIHTSLNDTTYSNISWTLYIASQIPQAQSTLSALVGTKAIITAADAVSSISRVLFFTGVPIERHNLTADSLSQQDDLLEDFMVDNYRSRLYDLEKDGLQGMSVNFFSMRLFMHDIIEQVVYDLLLAVGSFAFIFLFMLIQTGSLFLTVFAIASILTSFLGANLIYRIVFDYKYFGIFHVLSIFIILGIGSDNIFVFNDTWRATAYESYTSTEERLSMCYRRASKSMLITSLTTFAAFISNAFTPLLGISSFGVFSAILVLVNFLSAITFFPTVVILYHKNWENWTWPCCRPCYNYKWKGCPCSSKSQRQTEHRPNAAVRFFKGPYHRVVTHKIWRWFFIGACTGVLVTFLYFASKLEISEQGVQLYRKGNNYYEAEALNRNAFKMNLDDRNVKVIISFGLKNQKITNCHKTDYKCKGKTVWDNSFDLNAKPAQIALMQLCDKIKNLKGHDILNLKHDPVTDQVDMKCFILAMDNYIQSAGTDNAVFSPILNLSLPTSEMKFDDFFAQRHDIYNSTMVHGNFYRYFETIKSYWLSNGYKNNLTSDYGTYSVVLGETWDNFDTAPVLLMPDQYYGTKLRYAGLEISTTLIGGTKNYKQGLDIYNAWEEFVKEEMNNLPSSIQGVQFTTDDTWHEFKRQEALANSAIQGIIIGICLSFVVITLATTNIIISILATVIIVLVTLTIAGSIPMFGWKISVIESINLSLVVGLAVDYVVHLSESYHNSPHHDRVSKVRDMLEDMGLSVVSGALTTTGAAVFMMGAEIQFFLQFGIFIFCTIFFSILYSLCLFTPLLSLIGPQSSFGSLVPLVRWAWYKIIGRRKEDTDCSLCEGKGFCKPEELCEVS